MEFIHADSEALGRDALTERLLASLTAGRKTLWLLCGGSNIPIEAEIISALMERCTPESLQNLTIMQTDERFGDIGHPDSNWQQLISLIQFDDRIRSFPILTGNALADTVSRYGEVVEREFKNANSIIAQFGIGADGHIAGILPHSPGVTATDPVCGYEGDPFTRISITFPYLKKIDAAFVFAGGESKRKAVENLHTDMPLAESPCHILHMLPEVFFYSDLV